MAEEPAKLSLAGKIFKEIPLIPASSTKSERVFSTGGNVVTPKRGRLDPDMVEQLVVCHENVHLLKEFDKQIILMLIYPLFHLPAKP